MTIKPIKNNESKKITPATPKDVHLINAYLYGSILVLELNNGNDIRVNLGGITPPTPTSDIQLITSNNETFITSDNKNFILKEEI